MARELGAEAAVPAAEEVSRNPFTAAKYRLWWIASVAAGSGVGIQAVTVPLFIRDRVEEHERALAIAAALICQTLPGAIFALFGGVVADRFERRRILIRTYLVAALAALVYVALSGADVRWVWPVFILAAIVGSAGAFSNPARQAMMPQLLQQSQIQNGAIFGTLAFMATLQFGGPMVGGLLADLAGLTVAFAVEAAMLCIAALLFWQIATDQPVPSGRSVRGDLVEGVRYVLRTPTLVGIVALGTIPGMLIMGPFAVTIVLMVGDEFRAADRWVGFLWGSFGAGIVVGSLLLSVVRVRRRGLLLASSVFFGPAFTLGYGLSPNLGVAMACLFAAGIVGPAVFINYAVALLQENAERAMMGRVMSMYGLAFMASVPVGYLQAGIQASLWGPRPTIVSSLLVCMVLGVLAMLFLRPVTRLR
jgi:MFS family permease